MLKLVARACAASSFVVERRSRGLYQRWHDSSLQLLSFPLGECFLLHCQSVLARLETAEFVKTPLPVVHYVAGILFKFYVFHRHVKRGIDLRKLPFSTHSSCFRSALKNEAVIKMRLIIGTREACSPSLYAMKV